MEDEDCPRCSEEVEYDHFSTEPKLWHAQAPELAIRMEREKVSVGENDLRTLTQAKLFQLIKRKVLEHNWEDAALLMQGLTSQVKEPRSIQGKFIWEVGNEILLNHPLGRLEPHLMREHRTASSTLSANDVCKARILYEYGLYLMMQGDLNEAREVFRSFHTSGVKSTFTGNHIVHKNMMLAWSPVFEASLGMLDWIAWKQMENVNELIVVDDGQDQSLRTVLAEQAVSHFETAFQAPGIWDIFYIKYLEIMESQGRIVDAEDSLRAYALKNPNNPNAYKYWYDFLIRHLDTADNFASRIQALSGLQEIAPSEYYMLDLHKLRLEAAFLAKDRNFDQFLSMSSMAIGAIMDMLDFDMWVKDNNAWTLFAKTLRKVRKATENNGFQDILEAVWVNSTRCSWWPAYHFSARKAQIAAATCVELAKAKRRVARILLGSKCRFCIAITQLVEESEDER